MYQKRANGLRRRKYLAAVLFAGLLLGLSGRSRAEDESSLFWPPPPAEIRVIFVKSILAPKDIGVKPSLFNKLKSLLVGTEDDNLSRPIAVAVDGEGTIYVADPGTPAVHWFDQEAKRYKKITDMDGRALVSPVGVAVSKNGLIFVSDSILRRVFCLDKSGRLKFVIGQDGTLSRPTGLAADGEKLTVVDTGAHRLFIFDLEGHLIKAFGERGNGNGQFNYPTSVALDSEGRIYVVDTLNFRIQVFDKEYQYLDSIGQAGDSSGSFSLPKGVAVDSYGRIYSTDGLFDNVQIFSHDQQFLLSLGESGHRNGEFWIVSGIAIDRENTIYVADSYNQRVQVFRYVGKD